MIKKSQNGEEIVRDNKDVMENFEEDMSDPDDDACCVLDKQDELIFL
jgi:hypothetical protein